MLGLLLGENIGRTIEKLEYVLLTTNNSRIWLFRPDGHSIQCPTNPRDLPLRQPIVQIDDFAVLPFGLAHNDHILMIRTPRDPLNRPPKAEIQLLGEHRLTLKHLMDHKIPLFVARRHKPPVEVPRSRSDSRRVVEDDGGFCELVDDHAAAVEVQQALFADVEAGREACVRGGVPRVVLGDGSKVATGVYGNGDYINTIDP